MKKASKILKNAGYIDLNQMHQQQEEQKKSMFETKIETPEEFADQILSMFNDGHTLAVIKIQAERAYNSDAIDTDGLTKENFEAAKAVLSVIFDNLKTNYSPISKEGREIARNVSHFI